MTASSPGDGMSRRLKPREFIWPMVKSQKSLGNALRDTIDPLGAER